LASAGERVEPNRGGRGPKPAGWPRTVDNRRKKIERSPEGTVGGKNKIEFLKLGC